MRDWRWHLFEGRVYGAGVRANQDGIKVAGNEVARDVFKVSKHSLEPLTHLQRAKRKNLITFAYK